MKRILGVSARRTLPPLARRSFMAWFNRRSSRRLPASRRIVGTAALFVDPFTNYNYPEIAVAATEFMEAAGWRVLAVAGDDGRPSISKGMVERARTAARQTVELLAPLAEQGLSIVGLEPSSLLTLRDEILYLLPGDGRARLVAERALTFEEFVSQAADKGRLDVAFTDEPRRLLLHGHCHQKALVGMGPSKRALALPPNYQVTEVDSGCCGMAGSFGYEVEHYELSLKMAERRLLPAVRAATAETMVVAAGLSCRQQIEHGSGRKVLHPAQVLRSAIIG
jgi:Fe-S oxidoreductase